MSSIDAAGLETSPRDPDLRCSPWTQAQGVDPIGSAGSFDHLLLVEWPLPWPADVAEIPALAAAAADPRARVMAVVPRGEPGAFTTARVVHHRRVGTHRLAGVDHLVAPDAVPELLARLLDDLTADHLDWPSAAGEAPAEVLVCGHGRRDACCGRWGTLLHIELAATVTDARVWRCSHTGGHRFAPTAITLPDGRAWAYADADLIKGVVTRTAVVADLAAHDRGSFALSPWAQVVERAVFGQIGWSWLDHQVSGAQVELSDDSRSAQVRLDWRAIDGRTGHAVADVEVTRILPVLECGEPPATAKKTSPEYALRRLDITR